MKGLPIYKRHYIELILTKGQKEDSELRKWIFRFVTRKIRGFLLENFHFLNEVQSKFNKKVREPRIVGFRRVETV